jgi:hypothetical protein
MSPEAAEATFSFVFYMHAYMQVAFFLFFLSSFNFFHRRVDWPFTTHLLALFGHTLINTSRVSPCPLLACLPSSYIRARLLLYLLLLLLLLHQALISTQSRTPTNSLLPLSLTQSPRSKAKCPSPPCRASILSYLHLTQPTRNSRPFHSLSNAHISTSHRCIATTTPSVLGLRQR